MLHSALYEAAREVARLPLPDVEFVLERMLPQDRVRVAHALETDWEARARKKQRLPVGAWRYCVFLAGRGWGKTLTGAQAVRQAAESGLHEWISICGQTVSTLGRDMLSGSTGIMSISPRWFYPDHQVTRGQLVYPRHPVTGVRTRVILLSADRPDRIRGSQCSFLWADEPQSWTRAVEAWEMLDMTLRIGKAPRGVVTMTPKDNPFTRNLILGPLGDDGKRHPRSDVVVVKGTTYENTNLSPEVLESLRRQYEGTTIGRQELYAEVLEKPEAALWSKEGIDRFRVEGITSLIRRIVVGVDPSRSVAGLRDLCGIVVGASCADGHTYIVEDASIRGGPFQWAQKAASVALKWRADAIVFEKNAISEDIAKVIRQVSEATATHWKGIMAKGTKQMRAEPVAALYTAGRVHHVGTAFEHLEDEMTGWDPAAKDSPDRMDALVHVCTELALGQQSHPLAVR
jgi:phage terminase large subunit-like protein